MNKKLIVLLVIAAVLIVDQILKIYVKTHIEYGHGFNILGQDWARIHFVENEGMAFGLSFGGIIGKYVLSVFRIIMVSLLGYLLFTLIKANERTSLLISFALIVAGAMGNIIDSLVYGLMFSESYFHGGLATFVPFGQGYSSFLQGRVVDMLYFPMIDTILPSWIPLWGGERFEFFRPVFNIADSAISVGVVSILLFNRQFFLGDKSKKIVPVADNA